jgi:5-methylthioribose kinase
MLMKLISKVLVWNIQREIGYQIYNFVFHLYLFYVEKSVGKEVVLIIAVMEFVEVSGNLWPIAIVPYRPTKYP